MSGRFQASPDDKGWEDEAIRYGELCSREEAKREAGQALAGEIRRGPPGSTQPSQQRQEEGWGFVGEI